MCSDSAVLSAAAFGADPHRHPLPPATGAVQHWQRAVALGGQGYYARAGAELRAAGRCEPAPAIRSLLLSTAGSLRRQLGRHADAARLDGRALAVLSPQPDDSDAWPAARADALVGLAADALGCGRLRLSARLLERAGEPAAAAGWRGESRYAWVTAELALAGGDPATALAAARRAVRTAATGPSVRHRVKSALLLGVATAVSGEPDTGAVHAVEQDCERLGLVPLGWAAAMVAAGLGMAGAAARAERAATVIAARGGTIRVAMFTNDGVPDSR